ncbi:hypothetical protein BJP26_18780 [Sphingomonas melonis TY]|nr:hypothetical protein BJP26_18780 [Sphingomonas melonis TY]
MGPAHFNILNTYALVFTDGSPPAPIDTSWYGNMGLQGWVPLSQRGGLTGSGITGLDPNYRYTVALSNANAQYYTTADASGAFACTGILPGTYTLQVFKNELSVASQSVTVSAGISTPVGPISASDPSAQAAVWRIGDWDGSPQELLNGDKVTTMHPSDVRMASWTPGAFTVGTSTARQFPAYSWKDVNGVQTVNFQLAANQVADSKVRIGITTAYAGGRPVIRVNNWSSATTAASTQPSSRTLTIGSYRGNNTLYTFDVPASALVAGSNTLAISIVSGSGGSQWLSPGVSYDAIDFLQS